MNVPIILMIGGLVGLLYSIITISFFVGGKDDYSALQPMLTSVAVINLVATILMMVGVIMYVNANPANAQLLTIAISGLAIFFSMMSVSVSVLGKVYS
jgi:hypothetical protein